MENSELGRTKDHSNYINSLATHDRKVAEAAWEKDWEISKAAVDYTNACEDAIDAGLAKIAALSAWKNASKYLQADRDAAWEKIAALADWDASKYLHDAHDAAWEKIAARADWDASDYLRAAHYAYKEAYAAYKVARAVLDASNLYFEAAAVVFEAAGVLHTLAVAYTYDADAYDAANTVWIADYTAFVIAKAAYEAKVTAAAKAVCDSEAAWAAHDAAKAVAAFKAKRADYRQRRYNRTYSQRSYVTEDPDFDEADTMKAMQSWGGHSYEEGNEDPFLVALERQNNQERWEDQGYVD